MARRGPLAVLRNSGIGGQTTLILGCRGLIIVSGVYSGRYPRNRLGQKHPSNAIARILALQLPFLKISESMGNHDSKDRGRRQRRSKKRLRYGLRPLREVEEADTSVVRARTCCEDRSLFLEGLLGDEQRKTGLDAGGGSWRSWSMAAAGDPGSQGLGC